MVLKSSDKQKIKKIATISREKESKLIEEEKELDDSISDSEEDINENFDTYVNAVKFK